MNHFQKTSKKLERLRGSFFLTGLIIAGGLTLVAFEWTFLEHHTELKGVLIEEIEGDFEYTPPVNIEKEVKEIKKITPPKVKTDQIEIVTDDTPEPVEETKKEEKTLTIDPKYLTPPEIIEEEDIPRRGADVMPEYVGGFKEMKKFLQNTIKYPTTAKELGIKGKVYVGFIVGKNGVIRDIKVIKGVNDLLDQEAIRVVKAMPNWIPGKQHGKKVSVHYMLPINFTLM